ncbi:GGDEF domain-containing protein [Spirochaeta dissipatitropha]
MQINPRSYAKSAFLLMRLPLLLISATILVWFILGQIQSATLENGLRIVTFILVMTAVLLSVWFHANRTFFNSLLIFLLVLYSLMIGAADFQLFLTSEAVHVLQLTMPLCMVLVSLSSKRRIFSGFNLLWIILMLIISAYVILLPYYPMLRGPLQKIIDLRLIPEFMRPESWAVTDIAILLGVAGAMVMVWISLDRRNEPAFSSAWIGAYITMCIGLFLLPQPLVSLLWYAASAASICIALIQHAYALAYMDELTRVPNRRALQEQLLHLNPPYAIAMVDIDHFKKFNDTHGHDIGDQVLRRTASQLTTVGGGGKVFRYGGEEFTILFPGKDCREAARYCDAVRSMIAESAFHKRESASKKTKSSQKRASRAKALYVTISIGVSEPSERYPDNEKVILRADKALYRAKSQGRNRVVAGR